MILCSNRLYGTLRRKSAEDFDCQLWANTAHCDQPLKQTLFFAIEKTEERELIFTHLRVYMQRRFCTHAGQSCESRHGNDNIVPDAGTLHDGLSRLFMN